MNHSHLLRLLDDLMFRGDTDAYVKLRGALIEDAERERLPDVRPVKKMKATPTGQPKRRKRPGMVPTGASALAECPRCRVDAGQPCVSIGPRGNGKTIRYMHPERAGNRATLNIGEKP